MAAGGRLGFRKRGGARAIGGVRARATAAPASPALPRRRAEAPPRRSIALRSTQKDRRSKTLTRHGVRENPSFAKERGSISVRSPAPARTVSRDYLVIFSRRLCGIPGLSRGLTVGGTPSVGIEFTTSVTSLLSSTHTHGRARQPPPCIQRNHNAQRNAAHSTHRALLVGSRTHSLDTSHPRLHVVPVAAVVYTSTMACSGRPRPRHIHPSVSHRTTGGMAVTQLPQLEPAQERPWRRLATTPLLEAERARRRPWASASSPWASPARAAAP